jgi:transposase-like protein
MNELGNAEKQEVGRRANNRVENSHLSFRRREVVSDVDQPSLERHVGLERSRYPDLC